MDFEYKMLVLMTIFFLLAWVPASVGKARSYGKNWVASNRDTTPESKLFPWAQRCDRAYENLKSYFPGFVVAILLLGHLGKFDETTKWMSLAYVIARMIHMISYGAGNVPLRAVSFFVGMIANLVLLSKLLF